MEHLIEEVTRGNVTEVKVVLATVVLGLAVYQLVLAAVAYGWLRLPFLEAATASWTHRASGGVIVTLTILVATACLSFYGFEEGGAHFGPTSTAKLEAREGIVEERLKQREDLAEEREEAREERREESGGGPG
jgi:uncharacterized protein DUF6529